MDLITLDVGPVAHGGYCVARMGPDAPTPGKVVFVRHTLPGEKVRARLTHVTNKLARADAVAIVRASPDRVESVWPQAGPGGVGGGELAHVARPAQLRWKAAVIAEQFQHLAKRTVDIEVEPVGPDLGYRTRVRLMAGPDGRPGMYRPRSNEVVAVTHMPLATPRLQALPVWHQEFEPNTQIALVDAHSGAVVLRSGDEIPQIQEVVNYGPNRYHYRLDADRFWQVNVEAPTTLVETVMANVPDITGGRVWDLYCGAGLFTKPLADAVGTTGRVVGIDTAPAHDSEFGPQVDLRAGSVERALPRSRADVIVLDPPRAGAGARTCRALADAHPQRIIYVACDPAALARDTDFLTDAGYDLVGLRALDPFAQTYHVEQVAVFEPVRRR